MTWTTTEPYSRPWPRQPQLPPWPTAQRARQHCARHAQHARRPGLSPARGPWASTETGWRLP
eukprot:11222310-Lingulodinium_polyedra.AAC.1